MESSLVLQKKDFEAKVGSFLGYGRGAEFEETEWTSHQQAVITDCVESGLRRTYFPAVNGQTYDWSWRKPYKELTLASGARTVELPDDFGGLEGRITITSDSVTCPTAIDVYNEGRIHEAYAAFPDATGIPTMVALQHPKGVGPSRGQRSNIFVYPEADAEYTLGFAYYFVPDALSGRAPYAYGGPELSEVLLESCLAIAEERQDDQRGVHWMAFQEQLAAAVDADRRKKPQKFGYNGDRSDDMPTRRRHDDQVQVTFDGVAY